MDLTCLCLVLVRATMLGCGWVCNRTWRSNIVVCIPLVLRVRAVIAGWMKGAGVCVRVGLAF